MGCSSQSPGGPKGSRRKKVSKAICIEPPGWIVRLPVFILFAFMVLGASALGQEHSTRVSVGTLQMTGRGAEQRPAITAARRGTPASQTHISVGTLQMTGRGSAQQP
jgi:hypothetical protein